jgi:hypothetical protein
MEDWLSTGSLVYITIVHKGGCDETKIPTNHARFPDDYRLPEPVLWANQVSTSSRMYMDRSWGEPGMDYGCKLELWARADPGGRRGYRQCGRQ